MKKTTFIVANVVFFTLSMLMISCNNSSQGNTSVLTQEEKYATIESTRKYIENTVWTYTKPDHIWQRLEFKNGEVRLCSTFPSSGAWINCNTYSYKITEKRYSDTGNKYIAIDLYSDGESYVSFAPELGILNWWGTQVPMEQKDYQWD